MRTGEESHDLLLPGERLELRLLQQFRKALAAVELLLGKRIEVRAELGKRRQFTVLREIELEGGTTCLTALMAAEKPTRETERPTFTAGRTPELNRSVSKKIWPSVMEMTLVGM